jgi:flagellar hook-associated protein 2
MSGSTVSLADVLVSARLQMVGLPSLAKVQAGGGDPPVDPYAVPPSALVQLSGYGQLLGSGDRALTELKTVQGTSGNYASSTDQSIATAQATFGSAPASFSLNVSQMAQAKQMTSSAFFADPNASVLSSGQFTISLANGRATNVDFSGSTLNDLVNGINNADTGVSASISDSQFGYSLQLSASKTGLENAFTLTAPSGDPFNPLGTQLAQFGLTETQAAKDANFSVDGGAVQTSASNNDIALADKVNFSALRTGTATIDVGSMPVLASNLEELTTASNKLVQSYNSIRGTLTQLTQSGGTLEADTVAQSFSSTLFTDIQKNYVNAGSSLTTLSQVGFSSGAQNDPLTLNNASLASAFAIDASGTTRLVNSFMKQLYQDIEGYTKADGTLLSTSRSVQQGMAFLNGNSASAFPALPPWLKQYVLDQSMFGNANSPGLPRLSVFV